VQTHIQDFIILLFIFTYVEARRKKKTRGLSAMLEEESLVNSNMGDYNDGAGEGKAMNEGTGSADGEGSSNEGCGMQWDKEQVDEGLRERSMEESSDDDDEEPAHIALPPKASSSRI
jgi:hypothetical protein